MSAWLRACDTWVVRIIRLARSLALLSHLQTKRNPVRTSKDRDLVSFGVVVWEPSVTVLYAVSNSTAVSKATRSLAFSVGCCQVTGAAQSRRQTCFSPVPDGSSSHHSRLGFCELLSFCLVDMQSTLGPRYSSTPTFSISGCCSSPHVSPESFTHLRLPEDYWVRAPPLQPLFTPASFSETWLITQSPRK